MSYILVKYCDLTIKSDTAEDSICNSSHVWIYRILNLAGRQTVQLLLTSLGAAYTYGRVHPALPHWAVNLHFWPLKFHKKKTARWEFKIKCESFTWPPFGSLPIVSLCQSTGETCCGLLVRRSFGRSSIPAVVVRRASGVVAAVVLQATVHFFTTSIETFY